MKLRLLEGDIPGWLQRHKRRSYIIKATLSYPFWADRKALRKIFEEAVRLTRMTGIPHEVNHIIPLGHPQVSGLTVPWNLEIVTQRRNGAIGNCLELRTAEQLSLFEFSLVEQYQLPL